MPPNIPHMTGPVAAMFAETQHSGVPDQLFEGMPIGPGEMRQQILEARLNEIFDFLLRANPNNVRFLQINATHRNPLNAGLNAQDTSRIVDTGTIRK